MPGVLGLHVEQCERALRLGRAWQGQSTDRGLEQALGYNAWNQNSEDTCLQDDGIGAVVGSGRSPPAKQSWLPLYVLLAKTSASGAHTIQDATWLLSASGCPDRQATTRWCSCQD